jgi:hypothetical protein
MKVHLDGILTPILPYTAYLPCKTGVKWTHNGEVVSVRPHVPSPKVLNYIECCRVYLIFGLYRVQTGSGAHPASYSMGTGGPSLGVKRQGREVDHSLASSAEVKNGWSYASTPPSVFMAWCLVKHRDNLTFTFWCRIVSLITNFNYNLIGISICWTILLHVLTDRQFQFFSTMKSVTWGEDDAHAVESFLRSL